MTPKIRFVGLLAVSLLLAIVLGSQGSIATEHQRSDNFWSFTRLQAQEAEGFATIGDMAASVDHVIVGTVVDTGLSREFDITRGDGTPETVWYGRMTVAVDRVLAGPKLNQIDLEVFLPTPQAYKRFLDAEIPTERTLFFVRAKERAAIAAGWTETQAKSEAGYAMLVNLSQSFFRELGGRVHVPEPGAGDFTSPLEGITFSELLSKLE